MKKSKVFMCGRSLLLLGVAASLWACRPGVPSNYLDEDDMADVLCDYETALALAERKGDDPAPYVRGVFQKHGITAAEFDSSLVWYSRHSDVMFEVAKTAADRLEKESANERSMQSSSVVYSQYTAHGDTANIWNGRTAVLLSPTLMRNKMTFKIKADTTFYKGDKFLLTFNPLFIYQSGPRNGVACLAAVYEGDSVVANVRRFSGGETMEVELSTDRSLRLKELTGYICMSDKQEDNNVKLLLLSRISLVRFHLFPKDDSLEVAKKDSLHADSVAMDSLKADSVNRPTHADTMRVKKAFMQRMKNGGRPSVRPVPKKTKTR